MPKDEVDRFAVDEAGVGLRAQVAHAVDELHEQAVLLADLAPDVEAEEEGVLEAEQVLLLP